jgi:hypothetical protein
MARVMLLWVDVPYRVCTNIMDFMELKEHIPTELPDGYIYNFTASECYDVTVKIISDENNIRRVTLTADYSDKESYTVARMILVVIGRSYGLRPELIDAEETE